MKKTNSKKDLKKNLLKTWKEKQLQKKNIRAQEKAKKLENKRLKKSAKKMAKEDNKSSNEFTNLKSALCFILKDNVLKNYREIIKRKFADRETKTEFYELVDIYVKLSENTEFLIKKSEVAALPETKNITYHT